MKKYTLLALLAAAAMVIAPSLNADDKGKGDKGKGKGKDGIEVAVCPVSGKPINAEVKAEYKDGHVYFCCPGCPNAFGKNTEKFAAKANHQLVLTGQYKQTACPITGRPMNAAKVAKVGEVATQLCCGGCQKKFNNTAEKEQIDLLFSDAAFAKGFKPVQAQEQ